MQRGQDEAGHCCAEAQAQTHHGEDRDEEDEPQEGVGQDARSRPDRARGSVGGQAVEAGDGAGVEGGEMGHLPLSTGRLVRATAARGPDRRATTEFHADPSPRGGGEGSGSG
ncbi:hypothetical protein GCM10028815_31990 [Mariniluteicoccus flavus]